MQEKILWVTSKVQASNKRPEKPLSMTTTHCTALALALLWWVENDELSYELKTSAHNVRPQWLCGKWPSDSLFWSDTDTPPAPIMWRCAANTNKLDQTSAVKRSIGSTIGFPNHGESQTNPHVPYDFYVSNPISRLLTVGSMSVKHSVLIDS